MMRTFCSQVYKNVSKIFLIAIILHLIPLFFILSLNTEASSNNKFEDGEVIVKYKKDQFDLKNLNIMDRLKLSISEIGIDEKETLEDSNIIIYKDQSKSTQELLQKYIDDENVDYVEPNYILSIFAEPEDDIGENSDPNDVLFDFQWAFDNDAQTPPSDSIGITDVDIQAKKAWAITDSVDTEIVVGVIDTGIDYLHDDLKNNVWLNSGEFPGVDAAGNGDGKVTFDELTSFPSTPLDDFDDDGDVDLADLLSLNTNPAILYSNVFLDGVDDDDFDSNATTFIDDFFGWDFENDDNNPFDDNGHGTHVSGTIAAEKGNLIGVTGINTKAKIIPLKAFDAAGNGSLSNITQALGYANDMGIRITNNSWGITLSSGPISLSDEIDQAEALGFLFVAAAGNGHSNDSVGFDLDNDFSQVFPAAYTQDNIIAVTATTNRDIIPSFANWGSTSIDIGAPGQSIYSTYPGTYGYSSGTSMAAPHVTGAASLIWSYMENDLALIPNYLYIKNQLIDRGVSITDLDTLTVNDSDGVDGKRLDLFNSIPPKLSVSYLPEKIDGDVLDGDTVVSTLTSTKPGTIPGEVISSSFDYNFSNNGQFDFDFTDEGGNEETLTATVDWILNTTLNFPENQYISISNQGAMIFSGGCYDVENVQIDIDDLNDTPVTGTITETVSCSNGIWTSTSLDLTTLNDGQIDINVSQPGNVSIVNNTYQFTKDTLRPQDPVIISPAADTSTKSSSINISGTAESNSSISISGGNSTVNTTADGSGNFSTSVTLRSRQANTLIVTSYDVAGNASENTDQIIITQLASSSSSGGSSGGSSSDNTQTIFISEDFLFTDISGHTFESYINELATRNIVNGFRDGTYGADLGVTRLQMAKFIVLAFGFETDITGESFPDVDITTELGAYVQTIKNRGIVQGFDDGNYRGDEIVTRGQVTKFVVLAMQQKGIIVDFELENPFFDVPADSDFVEYIAFLTNQTVNNPSTGLDEKIIQGFPEGDYRLEEGLTRGQMAKIVWNSMVHSGLN